jgi:pimeloyl-ACP methyl ester carboxylesterase
MAKPVIDDVIVVLPGITGSVLQKDGRNVWAMTAETVADALFTLGRSIADLELRDDRADDGVTAPMVMPDLHLIPGLWKIDGYSKVSRYIQDHFHVTPGSNFHQFPYDWRRDNRLAAGKLKEKTDRWLHDWRRDHPDAKLILIGHSMGGLVSRYFIECLDGWRDTRMLITFGTPYRGSLNAFNTLVHGMKKSLGPITLIDLSRLLRSFTSVYQLLPIYPCLDTGDGRMIRVSEAVGLPNVDMDKARAGDAFHREIEAAVTAHLDDDEYLRNRYAIHPIVGTFQRTLVSARMSGDTVEFLDRYPGEDAGGDGTVPRVSATPIEFPHEEGAMFVAERHASLQNNDPVLVQLAGILSGRDTSRVRAGSSVGLDLDDAFGLGEPIYFRVRSEDPLAELTAVVSFADTHGTAARIRLGTGGDWRANEIPPLPLGAYRLTIAGESAVEPLSDVFVVVGDEDEPVGYETRRGRTTRSGDGIVVHADVDQVGAGGRLTGVDVGSLTEPEQGLEQRYLNGRFPQVVRLGDVVSLVVRVGVQPAERLSAALAPVAIPPDGVGVVLNLVDHPGFVARSPERVPLTVFPGADSAPAAFDLEASQSGVHTLQLEAFLGGTHLGGLHIQTTIEAAATTGEAVERSAPVGGRVRDPGEVSLLIHYEPRDAAYRYQLIDWSGDVPEEARSHQLLKTPSEAVEELVKQLNQVARGGSPWDANTTFAWLKNQGIALWNGFIPEALKREFWDRRDRISKLTVISSGDPVPWELLYPFDGADHDAGFLVDQFPVARYRYGVRPPNRLRITSADIVLSGTSSLASAPAEVESVTELLTAKSVATQTLGTVPALLERFEAANIGLIHFACHNAFEASAPSASRIMMEGQPFEPVFLEQHAGRFREAAPLVFMNACRTDGQAPMYTTVEGWASSFLRAGAGAFVGSLWEVVDSSASTYAQEFYRAALSGDTLGEAGRKARATIREEPGDPTWLAYTLYGDAAATIV